MLSLAEYCFSRTGDCVTDDVRAAIAGALPQIHEPGDNAWERRCAELSRRLEEQNGALIDAAAELAAEIRRREDAQAALLQAQKLEALGMVNSELAHDLNNVLQVVVCSFDRLAAGVDQPRLSRLVDLGRQAAARGTSLTQRLLAFARHDPSSPAIVDITAVCADIADLLRSLVKDSVRCTFETDPDLWPVLLDRRRLELVLMNLAVNAGHATPAGGQIVFAATNLPQGTVSPAGNSSTGDAVVVTVRDTGQGMTPEVLARATEPFFTTKGANRGTGLGLAMAESFAKQAGGSLSITSHVGQGASVEIVLPCAAPDAEEDETAQTDELHRGGVILFAEENQVLRDMAARGLRCLGYQVVEAANAQTAQVLGHTLARLDLVIASTTLPAGGGRQLAGQLRIEHPKLPVLFLAESNDRRQEPDMLVRPASVGAIGASVGRMLAGRNQFDPREETLSARLMNRLRSPILREVFTAWRVARADELLPRLEMARRFLAPHADWHFVAAVDGGSKPPSFHFCSMGRGLTGLLGQPLDGEPFDGADAGSLGSLASAYSRAAGSMLPVYDDARFGSGQEMPPSFERLIMPVSEDGQTLSHLVGVVLVNDLPFPSGTDEAP